MTSFFKRYIGFIAFLAILIAFFQQILNSSFIHPAIWYILLFFSVIGILSHLFTTWGMKQKSTQLFMTSTFGSMVIKLLGSILFIFIYLAFQPSNHFWFVINFFLLYFFFMAFEIYYLLHNLRAPKKEQKT